MMNTTTSVPAIFRAAFANADNNNTYEEETQSKNVQTKKRHTYRDRQDFRFVLRLRTRKDQQRVVVRVFEIESPDPNKSWLTAQVLVGTFEIFPLGSVVVESPVGGWESQEAAKLAVIRALVIDPRETTGMYKGLSTMQRAFLAENYTGLKRLVTLRS